MNKISIIIPIYNAEKTIKRCLNSILASGYENFEVIMIDDGSTDNSNSIVSEYANSDQRFTLITQSNLGPSAARNKGLEQARGDIISFIDSDDYIRNDYFEQLERGFKNNIDVVFYGFYRVDSKGVELSVHVPPDIHSDYFSKIIDLSEADMYGYTWIKSFRRNILRNTRFNENINLFEDEIFTCNLLKRPVNIYVLKEAIYYYVQSDGTLAQRTYDNYCQLCDMVYSAWKELLMKMPDGVDALRKKANHFAEICKYYGLERDVKPSLFYKKMKSCEFINNISTHDPLIMAIKKGKWVKVKWIYLKYKIKLAIVKLLIKREHK